MLIIEPATAPATVPPLDFATVGRLIEVAARAGAELALLRPNPAALAKAEATMPAIVAEQVRAFTLQHMQHMQHTGSRA